MPSLPKLPKFPKVLTCTTLPRLAQSLKVTTNDKNLVGYREVQLMAAPCHKELDTGYVSNVCGIANTRMHGVKYS